jgi:hypothetical protein
MAKSNAELAELEPGVGDAARPAPRVSHVRAGRVEPREPPVPAAVRLQAEPPACIVSST